MRASPEIVAFGSDCRPTNPAGNLRRSTAQIPGPETVAFGSDCRPTNPAGSLRRSTAQTTARAWFLLGAFLAATPALAQNDALRGTWSGQWIPESGYDASTVRFEVDGDTITGEMLNPATVAFDVIEFHPDTLELVAEAIDPDHGHFRIEARIEEVTRLNGTLFHDGAGGALRLTKWTYRPRR